METIPQTLSPLSKIFLPSPKDQASPPSKMGKTLIKLIQIADFLLGTLNCLQ